MAVLMEYAMFPTDKGASVSEFVSKIIDLISKSGYPYKLTPMGTIVEFEELRQALDLIEQSYKVLEPYSDRVYSTVKFDIKKNAENMMAKKVESIEKKIGSVSQ